MLFFIFCILSILKENQFCFMKSNTFLLYGANGYTGRLIARFASQYGLNPILAGRIAEPLQL